LRRLEIAELLHLFETLHDPATATEAMSQSGAAGVMIGRGAQGRPWQPALIAARLFGTKPPDIPTGADFVSMVAGHYEAILSFYGTGLGLRVARKHLGWYMDEAGTPPALRRVILTATAPAQVFELLPDALAHGERVAA
jgi:tRNA-dihydrouridine synthase